MRKKIVFIATIVLCAMQQGYAQAYKQQTVTASAGAEALFTEQKLALTHKRGAGASAKV